METLIKDAAAELSASIAHITEQVDRYLSASIKEIIIDPEEVFLQFPKWAYVDKATTDRMPKHSDLTTVIQAAARFKYSANGNNYNAEYFKENAESTSKFTSTSIHIAFWQYSILCQMGWDTDNLSMWVVKDRDTNIKYTILVALHGGKEWLLNAPAKMLEPVEVTPHYMNKTFKFMCRIREKDSI